MKFKVGDKIRIVDTDGINQNGYRNKYMNGDIIEIQDIDEDGVNWYSRNGYAPIASKEYHCIELVTKEEPKKLVRENFVVGDIIQDNFGERFTVYNTDGYGNILINKGWVSGSGFSFVNSNEAKIVENSPVILSTQHTISVGSNTLTLSTAELKALQSEIAKVLS